MELKFLILLCVLAVCNVQGYETSEPQKNITVKEVDDPSKPQNNVAFFAVDSPNVAISSGGIIHYKWIVTAASCVRKYSFSELRFRQGGNFTTPAQSETHFSLGSLIYDIICHPSYVELTRANDIALINTLENIPVQPYRITKTNPSVLNLEVILKGYGPLNADPSVINLSEVSAALTSIAQCHKYDLTIPTNKLCSIRGRNCKGHETIKVQPKLIGTGITHTSGALNNVAFFTIDSQNIAICSGAVIHSNWIVTAASCVKQYSLVEIRFKNGGDLIPVPGKTYYEDGKQIDKIFNHPSYVDLTRANDIALIKTMLPINEQQYKITRVNPNVINTNAYLMGYGPIDTAHVGQTSGILTEAPATLFSITNCRQYDTTAQTTKLCSLGGRVCQGDQGGPLVLKSNTNELIGIISVSPGIEYLCGLGIKPIVTYTNIFLYRSWIVKTTGINM